MLMLTNSLRPEDKPKYVLNTHSNRSQVISNFLTVPGYAHAAFSPKFFMRFCSDGPCEFTGQKRPWVLYIVRIYKVQLIKMDVHGCPYKMLKLKSVTE